MGGGIGSDAAGKIEENYQDWGAFNVFK